MTHTRHILFCCLCFVSIGLSLRAAGADTKDLPAWQVLEFEEKAFWATAKSRVEIEPAMASDQTWSLSASSSVVNNSEQVRLSFIPANGQVLNRTRLSRGRNQRFKSFDYQTDQVVRERRSPGADPNIPPEEWPVTSTNNVAFPLFPNESVITDSYVLLLLADRFQVGKNELSEVVIHTDFNFYRVSMTRGNGIPVEVDYQIAGGEKISGRRETRAVALQVSPVGTPVDKPDFSLLGLHGEIILLFDRETGLLLQVRGTAPRIGATEINLKSVTMREPLV